MEHAIPGTLMLIGLVLFAGSELIRQYIDRALEPPDDEPWELDPHNLNLATGHTDKDAA